MNVRVCSNVYIRLLVYKFYSIFVEKKNIYDFRIVWKTKKVRQLFPLKDKSSCPSCKIYE